MTHRKTDAEISAEIVALKSLKQSVPRFTLFEEDNHAAIDAQCAVLAERMTHDDVYEAFGNEDHSNFAQHILDAALAARHWMCGLRDVGEGRPSEDWTGIEAGT